MVVYLVLNGLESFLSSFIDVPAWWPKESFFEGGLPLFLFEIS
jgi:hypothetical protein